MRTLTYYVSTLINIIGSGCNYLYVRLATTHISDSDKFSPAIFPSVMKQTASGCPGGASRDPVLWMTVLLRSPPLSLEKMNLFVFIKVIRGGGHRIQSCSFFFLRRMLIAREHSSAMRQAKRIW